MSDPQTDKPGLLRRFWALPTDSVPKTLFVAIALCLFASMIVSAAAVALRPQLAQIGDRGFQLVALLGQNLKLAVGQPDPDAGLFLRALFAIDQQPLPDILKRKAKAPAAQDQLHPRHLARAVKA